MTFIRSIPFWLLLVVTGVVIFRGVHMKPVEQHWFNRIFKVVSYKPLKEVPFELDTKSFSTIISLNNVPKELYVIGFRRGEDGFPEKFKFNGKLSVQYLDKFKNILREEIIVDSKTSIYGSDNKSYKEILFTSFDYPCFKGENARFIKITVIEPFIESAQLPNTMLYIAVSPEI